MGSPLSTAEILAMVQDTTLGVAERNRGITNAYHRLSEAMRAELDAGPNLDWCGFAKWSSYTVGLNFEPAGNGARATEQAALIIQHLPRLLGFLRPIVENLLEKFIDVDDGLVAKALRGGNGTIFVEMGWVFARLLDRLPERNLPNRLPDRDFAQGVVDEVVTDAMKSFLPPLSHEFLDEPGTEPLVQGILYYLRAQDDPDHVAELMLAGNMLFSVYEQSRANRLIAIGMCAPIRGQATRETSVRSTARQ